MFKANLRISQLISENLAMPTTSPRRTRLNGFRSNWNGNEPSSRTLVHCSVYGHRAILSSRVCWGGAALDMVEHPRPTDLLRRYLRCVNYAESPTQDTRRSALSIVEINT
jgi:hypothetical protein